MRALYCAASLLGVLAVLAWATSPAGAQDNKKVPTARQIMTKIHKGRNNPFATVKAQLRQSSPNWAKVASAAEVIEKYGSALPKARAPRGNRASFEKLAQAYASNTKTLKEAAEQKDLASAREATENIGGSCKTCHSAHRRKG